MDSPTTESGPLIMYKLGEPSGSAKDPSQQALSSTNVERLLSNSAAAATEHKKNLVVLSVAFLFNFTAYLALQNLQSSLHPESGVASLSVIYGGMILSSLFAPALIRGIGAKWSIAVCILCFAVYTVSNYYPSYYTLIPAGLILGLAAAPLWIAQGTYLTTTAIGYADVTNRVPENVINQFNGVFFFFFQGSQITGNLVASLVLFPQANGSYSDANYTQCGMRSCGGPKASDGNDTLGSAVSLASQTTITLVSVYLVCGLFSFFLVGLLLSKLEVAGAGVFESTRANLVATLRLLLKPQIFLLVPLFIYSGMEQAFIFGDFTKAYITCTSGIYYVGFVMMVFGFTDAVCCILFGRLEKYTGRIVIFSAGGVAHALIISILLFVPGVNDDQYGLWDRFVMAAVWGFGDAVWQTQITSILGVIFPENQEPAFSNLRLFQAVGFCVYFGLSTSVYVCVFHKLIAIGILLIISMVMYYTVEWKIQQAIHAIL